MKRIIFARYDENGKPDPSFGVGGKVSQQIGENSQIKALTFQDGNRVVAAGYNNGNNLLARYWLR